MTYLILGVLFIGVFAFIAWRIIADAPKTSPEKNTYICPYCNEQDCDCRKDNP